MRCQNKVSDTLAYFFQGLRKNAGCIGEARWEVTMNPPRAGDDGKVRLCDHCNGLDYIGFQRIALGKSETPK